MEIDYESLRMWLYTYGGFVCTPFLQIPTLMKSASKLIICAPFICCPPRTRQHLSICTEGVRKKKVKKRKQNKKEIGMVYCSVVPKEIIYTRRNIRGLVQKLFFPPPPPNVVRFVASARCGRSRRVPMLSHSAPSPSV